MAGSIENTGVGEYNMDAERRAMMSTVSERLMDVLNHIGLSEEVRWKRRQLAVEFETIMTTTHYHSNIETYIFGSQSEGSTTPGLSSDVDSLICDNKRNIIETMAEWIQGRPNCLMLQDELTRPGYVKLWACDPFTRQTLIGDYRDYGDLFVYDNHGRCLHSRPNSVPIQFSRNGPAETVSLWNKYSFDQVKAYRCHSWPQQARDWFNKRRPYNWPSQEMMSHIKNNGCFLVPIGHPFSEERELEWKISFSLSERELIWSLNEVQFKCYVLMKIVVKTFFKPYMEDGLCSYHCKMCILHVTENTDKGLWRADNLLLGLSECLGYFRSSLETGKLPHYFMPEHNLFEHKVHDEVRTQAYSILQGLISEDFGFLQRIECDNIGQLLCTSCSSGVVQMLRFTVSESAYESIGYMAAANVSSAHPGTIEESYHILSSRAGHFRADVLCLSIAHLHHLPTSNDDAIRTASHCLLPPQLANLAFYILSNFTSLPNVKDRVYVRSLAVNAIKDQSVSSLLTTKLKVAGICCMYGSIDVTMDLLDDIKRQEGACLIRLCVCKGILNAIDLNSVGHCMLDNDCSLDRLASTLTSTCVMYSPEEIGITPKALQYEMFRSVCDEEQRNEGLYFWYDGAAIDPPMYMYYLQYVCLGHLNRTTEKSRVLRNMIAKIRSIKNLGHIETALNILGHCLMVEQKYNAAYKCFRLSMMYRAEVSKSYAKIQRSPHHHNAAKWHIAVMLNNIFKMR